MSINKKVFLLISVLFCLLSLIFFSVLKNRENNSIVFEDSLIERKVHNLNNILKDRLDLLNTLSYEYSINDDLINQLRENNLDFSKYESITSKLNISYFMILNQNKEAIYSQAYDINSKEFLDVPNDASEFFKRANIENFLLHKEKLKFVTFDYEKLIFSIEKIDELGYIFVARTIDSTFLSNISSILDSYVSFLPSHNLINIHKNRDIKYDVHRADENNIYTNLEFIDSLDNSKFYLSLKINREFFKEISNSNEMLLSLFIFSSFVLILLMYTFINKIFTKRIGIISKTVKNISKNKNLCENIELIYNDEITYLSKKMNEMFDVINSSQNEKIRKERDFLQSVLDSQQHIIFITDGNTIQSANKKFLDIFKSSNNFMDNIALMDSRTKNSLLKIAKEHSSIDKPAKFETEKDSKYFVFDISRVEVQKYIVCMNDVSKVNEKILRLETKASTDQLTKCLNKASVIEYCKYWLEVKKFGMIVLDIDKFKHVNDTYGHLCGDIILKDLSSLIKNHLQQGDIIGRFGGEEFVVLIDDCSIENIKAISERLRVIVENYVFIYEDIKLKITVSLGCTLCSKSNTYEELFKLADEALYVAKNSGRNQVIYKCAA